MKIDNSDAKPRGDVGQGKETVPIQNIGVDFGMSYLSQLTGPMVYFVDNILLTNNKL